MFPGTALCSRSVKGLYEKVSRRDSPLKSDPLWEDMLSAASHRSTRLWLHGWPLPHDRPARAWLRAHATFGSLTSWI